MIAGIIQARMSSNRLPGKVLMPINGKTILQWVVDVANASEMIDKVIVATSNVPTDEKIREYCYANDIAWTAGSLNDVLDRYYTTALQYRPEHIVRLPADCPFRNPKIIDSTILYHLRGDYNYTTNHSGEVAEGYNVEVFDYKTLLRAHKLATEPYDREHVTPWMKRLENTGLFQDYLPPDQKLSIDTLEDYERLKLHFPA